MNARYLGELTLNSSFTWPGEGVDRSLVLNLGSSQIYLNQNDIWKKG